MKKNMVTRSAIGRTFNIEDGDLVRYKRYDSKQQFVQVTKTFKVIKVYPHMFRCQDFDGHIECFSNGDFYCGLIQKIETE